MIKSMKLRYLLHNRQNFVTLLFLRHVGSSIPSSFFQKIYKSRCHILDIIQY